MEYEGESGRKDELNSQFNKKRQIQLNVLYVDIDDDNDDDDQSVSGTLDRPRVVAPSKTCGHVRSSRRRWR